MAATPLSGKVRLQIEISTAGDHLRAHFHTDQPVPDIILNDKMAEDAASMVRPVQLRQWRPAGPGWSPFDKGLARADGKPFQDADLDIYPDDQALLWVEPLVFPAGGGFVLYSEYLVADRAHFDTTLKLKPAPGEIVDYGASSSSSYLYVGPAKSLVSEAGIHVVAGSEVPAWLRSRAASTLARSIKFYEEGLQRAFPPAPTLIIAMLPPTPGTLSFGRAGPSGTVTFRLFGQDFQAERAPSRAAVDQNMAHEAFHFWNGGAARGRTGYEAAWLVEGGANYAALLALRAAGDLADGAWYREFDRHLAACRTSLGAGGLAQFSGLVRHRSAYECGLIIQWICDLAAQHRSHQQRGFFDLWRDLLRKAQTSPGGAYSIEDFRAWVSNTDPAALAMIDLLLQPDPGDRWSRLRALLESYGVRTGPAPQSEIEARLDLFKHLLRQDCAGAFTFHFSDNSARLLLSLDRGSCRHFAAENDFVEIEGHSPISDIYGAYAAVVNKCQARRAVGLTFGDGRSIGIVCTRPLPWLAASPADFVVRGLP